MTMAMDANKQKALDMAIKQIDKTFGKNHQVKRLWHCKRSRLHKKKTWSVLL
jgi:hypothetical protein